MANQNKPKGKLDHLVMGVKLGGAVGSVLGYLARQSIAKKQLGTAEGKVNKMITDAEAEAQSILLTAKNKAVEVLEDVKKEEMNIEK